MAEDAKVQSAPSQQYVLDCEPGTCQFGIKLQFTPEATVMWYHQLKDFIGPDRPPDADCPQWEMAAAASYARCAAALEAGDITGVALPRIAMGGLRLGLSADRSVAFLHHTTSAYAGSSRALHAVGVATESTWRMPTTRLVAIFLEAAATIRSIYGEN